MSQTTEDKKNTATPPKQGISACLIVRNEEQFLPECLASLRPWVEEICVVDTGSTDGTISIAQSFGAAIGHFTWCDDFSAARNASLALATYPWILMIDADEVLDAKTGPALRQAIADTGSQALLVQNDSQLEGGKVNSLLQPRLFRNHPQIRFSRPVHEDITDSLFQLGMTSINQSGVRLLHRGYMPAIIAARNKVPRNLAILRTRVRQEPEDLYSTWKLAAALGQPEQAEERLAAFTSAHLIAEGMTPEARAEYPFLPLVYAGLAAGLADQGALTSALSIVGQANTHFPGNIDVVFRHGDLLRRTGDVEGAARLLKQCVGADRASPFYSGDSAARGVLPALGLSLMALEAGHVDAATSNVALALRFEPEHIEARCLQVRVLMSQGHVPQASAALNELMSRAPTAPAVQLLGGELAWLQGDHPMAMDLWRSAVGPTEVGNDARAQLAIAELAYGSKTAALLHLPDLAARDLPSSACKLLLSVQCGAECTIDPALRPPSLLRHLAFWLRELATAGKADLLEAFMERTVRYEDRLPGIAKLVVTA